MKIINCGTVVYLITAHHIARIEYRHDKEGKPIAWNYYDNQLGEGVQAENGRTMRCAFRLARWTIRHEEHWSQIKWNTRRNDYYKTRT